MAEYTENLNLIKPAQDEQYNVDDFNDNFDKIDDFAGLVPPRALTADKLTTGAKINGINFKGDADIITGLGLYSDINTYNNTNLAYLYDNNSKLRIFQSLQNGNIGHNPLTNSVYWKEIQIGSKRHYGETVTSSLPIIDDDTLHLANGSLLTQQDYPEFVSYIANLYNSLPTGDFSQAVQIQNFSSYGYWRGVAYGNGKYLAVTSGNYYSTSTDGTNWDTPISITTTDSLSDVVFDGDKFVAICYEGEILTSSNGTIWTSGTTLSGNGYYGIAYGNSKYVILDAYGIKTSSNLTSWTTTYSKTQKITQPSHSITYVNNKFIASIITNDDEYIIVTSEDGETWTEYNNVNLPITRGQQNINYTKIFFKDNKYQIIDNQGYISTTTNDFVNWTTPTQNTNLGNHSWYALTVNDLDTEILVLGTSGYVSLNQIPFTNVFTTEANWQTSYTTYGECGKYVYDSTNNTVRIPLYNSYFTYTANSQILGNLTEASLPNIKATVSNLLLQDGTNYFDWQGAFYNAGIGGKSYRATNTTEIATDVDNIGLNANNYNSIYKDSATTVNTQSIKQLVYIVVRA